MLKSPIRPIAVLVLLATSGAALAAPVTTVQSLPQGSALVTVDNATPTTIISSTPISGLPTGDRLIGFTSSSAGSRVLYGVDAAGQNFVVNGATGVATPVGAPLGFTGFPAHAGVSLNPVTSQLRIVTDADQNFRVTPGTGAAVSLDTNIAYVPGDSGAGVNPNVGAAAHSNAVRGATSTQLYVIDTNRGVLATLGSATVPAEAGQLNTVGALGVNTGANAGFGISGSGQNTALLSDKVSGQEALYSVNLTTGAATLLGVLPAGDFNGLAFTATPLQQIGLTTNQQNVGGVLDNFTLVPSAGLISLFGALDTLPTDAARAQALNQLTPASFALLPELLFQTTDSIDQTIRRYQRDVRAGGTDENAGEVRFGADRKLGMFFVGNGRTGFIGKNTAGSNRTTVGSVGGTGGVDFRLTDKILIGGFGGYDATQARLDPLSPQSDIHTWYAGGYGSLGVGPIYVDAHADYSKSTFRMPRIVSFGGFEESNLSHMNSYNWNAGGTIGASVKAMGIEAEPYAGVNYTHLRLHDFAETGRYGQPTTTALTIFERHGIESLQSIAGLRLGLAIPIAGTSTVVRPTLRGEYHHEFDDKNSRTIVATLADTGVNSAFAFGTTPLSADFAAVGAGFTVSGASPISLVVDYNGELAKDRSIHGITGGFRLSF